MPVPPPLEPLPLDEPPLDAPVPPLLPDGPASPSSALHGPQTPGVPGEDETHEVPGQQSALLVHEPHAAMQAVPAHTNGGAPPSTALGTQGKLPQQLALDAHAPPAATH